MKNYKKNFPKKIEKNLAEPTFIVCYEAIYKQTDGDAVKTVLEDAGITCIQMTAPGALPQKK